MTNFVPISGLTAGTQTLSTDLYPGVDTTDFTQAPTGTTKKYTIPNLTDYCSANILSQRLSCVCATTANLTVTYANGTAGVGATLTNAGAQAAFSLDDITPAVGSRILIKDQSAQTQNGIYTLTNAGSGASNWVLTRATDYDNHIANLVTVGTYTLVESGTVNGGNIFYQTTTGTIVIGTNNIVFMALGPSGGLSGFSYINVPTTSVTMVQNKGYIANNAGLVTLTTPATATFGSVLEVVGWGTGGWKIQLTGAQTINIGSSATSAGGTVASTNAKDSVRLVCSVADTSWVTVGGPQSAGLTIT